MRRSLIARIALSSCVIVGISLFMCSQAHARKPIFAGRGQGMATIDIDGSSLEKVEAAVEKIFVSGEGYSLKDSGDLSYVFERPAGRMKDIGYGGLVNEGGTVDRAVVQIEEKSATSFRVQCDVYMISNSGDDFFEDNTKVLRAFGREYQRVLRDVKKEATRK